MAAHRTPPKQPDRRLALGALVAAVLLIVGLSFAATHHTAAQTDQAITVANDAATQAQTILGPVQELCAGDGPAARALAEARTKDGQPFCEAAAQVAANPVIANPREAAGVPATVTEVLPAPPAATATVTATEAAPPGALATVTQAAPPPQTVTQTATALPPPPQTVTATQPAPPAETVTQTQTAPPVTQTETQPPVTQTEQPPPPDTVTQTETQPAPPADSSGTGDSGATSGDSGGTVPLPTMTEQPTATDPPLGQLTVPNPLSGLTGGTGGRNGTGGSRNQRGR
jgi:hypothetical protein